MRRKVNVGKDADHAIETARALNRRYVLRAEREAQRLDSVVDVPGALFSSAFPAYVDKYCDDYRLKSSTRTLLSQRTSRLTSRMGDVPLALITTQLLREAIEQDSAFEQGKLRTLLRRFFQFAKSHGRYPQHLPNPVDDLYVDPAPRSAVSG